MDIAFILGDDTHYYGAGVKPLVDLSFGLSSIGVNSHLLLKRNQVMAEKEIREITEDKLDLTIYDDLSETIASLNPEYIMTHDYSMSKLKEYDRFKRVVYTQILFGLNSLNPYTSRKSMRFKISSYIPWNILTRTYVNTIHKFDYVIANSEFTKDLLLNFYNVNSAGVVYPPVGTNLRKFVESITVEEKRGILIYLGHFPDYYSRDILKEIEILRSNGDFPIRLIVDNREMLAVKDVEIYSELTSEELAHLYAKSSVTYIPTINEMFGHVGAESLLFETPVILDNYHPFLEFFPKESNAVVISTPKETIYQSYKEMLQTDVDIEKARKFVTLTYSPINSAKKLISLIG